MSDKRLLTEEELALIRLRAPRSIVTGQGHAVVSWSGENMDALALLAHIDALQSQHDALVSEIAEHKAAYRAVNASLVDALARLATAGHMAHAARAFLEYCANSGVVGPTMVQLGMALAKYDNPARG